MSLGVELFRSQTQALPQSQAMETDEDSPKSSGMFWEIPGLRQLVVDYLDPRTAETAARFFCIKDSFNIFKRSLEVCTYAEKECIDFIRERFGTENEKPSLMYVIKQYLPSLEILKFTTFPVPASIVLQLSRDSHTAIILFRSCAFLQQIDGANVRRILADKMLNTLGNTGAIEKDEIPDLKAAFAKKRKAEEPIRTKSPKRFREILRQIF